MDVIRADGKHQGIRRPDMWSVEYAGSASPCLTRGIALRYTVSNLHASYARSSVPSKGVHVNADRLKYICPPEFSFPMSAISNSLSQFYLQAKRLMIIPSIYCLADVNLRLELLRTYMSFPESCRLIPFIIFSCLHLV